MFLLPLDSFKHVIFDILTLMIWLIIVEAIVWNIAVYTRKFSPYRGFPKFLRTLVDPVLIPLRGILPAPAKTGGMDFAPFVAIILLQVVRMWFI